METFDTIVIGAGQAGLAISHGLAEAGVAHVVLERGRIGESWRSQRWDSFTLNTPNWANLLPGSTLGDREEGGFEDRDDFVARLEAYAAGFAAPVRQQTAVMSLQRDEDDGFLVETATGQLRARNVVVCSGALNVPRVPAMADHLPDGIASLTAESYDNPESLAPGAVVVVGSGQSGCQIAEELLAAGRTVHLCVSKVARVPRSYRGRDIIDWLVEVGFFDATVGDLEQPAMQHAAQPQVSGTRGGHSVSLQSLARDGAMLLGRVEGIEGTELTLLPNVLECAAFADQKCEEIKQGIDRFIAAGHLDAPPPQPDPNEPPMPDLAGSEARTSLDLSAEGVSTIIWCVGFGADFSWIQFDVHDERGEPRHLDGVAEIPGLYFVGFPWLSKRKSGILFGIAEDATRIVAHLTSRADTAGR